MALEKSGKEGDLRPKQNRQKDMYDGERIGKEEKEGGTLTKGRGKKFF